MKFVPARASRFVSRQKLKINMHSPTLLLGAGIAGVVGTTILASRATLKAQPVFEATHLELEEIAYNADKVLDETGLRVPDSQLRKQRVAVYTDTAVQLTKMYGPSVILGGISIACLVQSHRILSDRYSSMATAYVALQETFDRYRNRVRGELGEEKERDLYYNGQEHILIEPGPNGPKKSKIRTFGDGGGSPYARLFSNETSSEWKDTPEYNVMFLRQVEKHCNDRLKRDGHLFLNRVYEELGLDDTGLGARVGWLYERGHGDDFVDFGIFSNDMKSRLLDFMVGNEGEIYVDFNVVGPIDHLLTLQKVKG